MTFQPGQKVIHVVKEFHFRANREKIIKKYEHEVEIVSKTEMMWKVKRPDGSFKYVDEESLRAK